MEPTKKASSPLFQWFGQSEDDLWKVKVIEDEGDSLAFSVFFRGRDVVKIPSSRVLGWVDPSIRYRKYPYSEKSDDHRLCKLLKPIISPDFTQLVWALRTIDFGSKTLVAHLGPATDLHWLVRSADTFETINASRISGLDEWFQSSPNPEFWPCKIRAILAVYKIELHEEPLSIECLEQKPIYINLTKTSVMTGLPLSRFANAKYIRQVCRCDEHEQLFLARSDKPLSDDHLLVEYGIGDHVEIYTSGGKRRRLKEKQCSSKEPGLVTSGLQSVTFADITSPKLKSLENEPPQWRQLMAGLSMKGLCPNPNCEAFTKLVLASCGFGKFNINKLVHDSQCPSCHSVVEEVLTCALHNCIYSVEGRATSLREIESRDSEPVPKDRQLTFDIEEKKEWLWLEIEVKKREEGRGNSGKEELNSNNE